MHAAAGCVPLGCLAAGAFGRDARNRQVDLPLVWTSLLVGAIPRQGKTFAAQLAAAGLILDPHTRERTSSGSVLRSLSPRSQELGLLLDVPWVMQLDLDFLASAPGQDRGVLTLG